MRNARALQRIAIILAVLFVLSLLPVMAVAFYNHPRADDYTYGAVLRKVIDAGQGLPEAVAAIAAYVRSTYARWQGSFSAVMLFTLQPGVFSDNAYWLTTALTLLPLLLGTGMLLRQLGKMLHAPRATVVLIFLSLMTLSIQLVPDLNQTFYWFNGGCYYTLYYALSLMLLTGTLRICTDGKCRAGRTALCMLLAFFIGGGNYTTIVVTLILLMLLLLALLVRKKTAWRQILLVMTALLTAFAINAAAPGNRVRAATIPRSMDAIPAILYSFDRAWVPRVGLVWLAAGNCYCAFRPADVGVCRAVRVEIPLSAAEKRAGVCHLFGANDAVAFCNGECRAGAANRHLLLCVWLAAALLDVPLGRLAAEQPHRHENRRGAFASDAPFRRNRRHIVACAGADAAICASDGGRSTDEHCSSESAHQRRGADVSSAVHRNPPNAASARRDLRNPGCCGLSGVPEPAGAGGRGAVGLLGESGAGKLFRASAGHPH